MTGYLQAEVEPRFVVLQKGFLEMLASKGAKTVRNDINGIIEVICRGGSFWVKTAKD